MFCRNLLKSTYAVIILLLAVACSGSKKEQPISTLDAEMLDELTLFVGTYTQKEGHVDGKADGIYVYRMDPLTGGLSYVSTSPSIINPSYLTVHPNRKYLYAISETGGEGSELSGSVVAFNIDPTTSELTSINQVSSGGDWPCYISVDYDGKFAFVANYGGTIAMLPIKEDGSLEIASNVIEHIGSGPTSRQEGPHAHMIIPGFDNEQVYAVDLGADKIFRYHLNTETQVLEPLANAVDMDAGSGPRHLALHPKQKVAYAINELSGTVTAFQINDDGMLEMFQSISTLADGIEADAASADIQVHPSGDFLYASNRGEVNNIAIYAISAQDGSLELVGHQSSLGKGPRSFVIDPSGTYLLVANQDTSDVYTFTIDKSTGLLEDNPVKTSIPTPVCLKFL